MKKLQAQISVGSSKIGGEMGMGRPNEAGNQVWETSLGCVLCPCIYLRTDSNGGVEGGEISHTTRTATWPRRRRYYRPSTRLQGWKPVVVYSAAPGWLIPGGKKGNGLF